jgi:hypothetical protein
VLCYDLDERVLIGRLVVGYDIGLMVKRKD